MNKEEIYDQIAYQINKTEHHKDFILDPITIMVISSAIKIIVEQFLIPWLEKRCKERFNNPESLPETVKKISPWHRFLLRRGAKKILETQQILPELSKRNLTTDDILNIIIRYTRNSSPENMAFAVKSIKIS